MSFEMVIHVTARTIEVFGILVIVIGVILASIRFAIAYLSSHEIKLHYHAYRSNLGRAILLGLELLVAADIIATVTVEPTLRSVAVLGLIVIIRTFLSFSLEVEIEGAWPWQRQRHHQQRD